MSYRRLVSLVAAGTLASALGGCGGGANGSLPSATQGSPLTNGKSSAKPMVNDLAVATNIWVVDGNQLKEYPVTANGAVGPSATFNFSNPHGPSGRIVVRNFGGTNFVIYAVGSQSEMLEDEIIPGNPNLKNVGGVTWIPTLTNATDVVMTDANLPMALVEQKGNPNATIVPFNSSWTPQTAIQVNTGSTLGHIALDPFSQDVWFYPGSGGNVKLYSPISRAVIVTQPVWSGQSGGLDVNENEELFAATYVGGLPGFNEFENPPNNQYDILNSGNQILQYVYAIASDKQHAFVLGQDFNYNYEIDVYPDATPPAYPARIIDSGLVNPTQVTVN